MHGETYPAYLKRNTLSECYFMYLYIDNEQKELFLRGHGHSVQAAVDEETPCSLAWATTEEQFGHITHISQTDFHSKTKNIAL